MKEENLKYRVLSLFKILLLGLIMEFLSGCSDKKENVSPHADYIFRGTIISDKTSLPIKNLSISIENYGNNICYTREDGGYSFEYNEVPITTEWYFSLEDTDSLENGLFELKDTIIYLNNDFLHDYNGESYYGRIESDIIIKMKGI